MLLIYSISSNVYALNGLTKTELRGSRTAYNALAAKFPDVFEKRNDGGAALGWGILNFKPLSGSNNMNFVNSLFFYNESGSEIFHYNGQPAFCFDIFTPFGDGGVQPQKISLGQYGVTNKSEEHMKLIAARVSEISANNFQFYKDNASAIARGYTENGFNIQKSKVEEVLRSDDPLAIQFKHLLTQVWVWFNVNSDSTTRFLTVSYNAVGGTGGGKEGDGGTVGGSPYMAPISYIFNFDGIGEKISQKVPTVPQNFDSSSWYVPGNGRQLVFIPLTTGKGKIVKTF